MCIFKTLPRWLGCSSRMRTPDLKKNSTNSYCYLEFWTPFKFCVPESQTQFTFLSWLFNFSVIPRKSDSMAEISVFLICIDILYTHQQNRNQHPIPWGHMFEFLYLATKIAQHTTLTKLWDGGTKAVALGWYSSFLPLGAKQKWKFAVIFLHISKSVSERSSKCCILKRKGV